MNLVDFFTSKGISFLLLLVVVAMDPLAVAKKNKKMQLNFRFYYTIQNAKWIITIYKYQVYSQT